MSIAFAGETGGVLIAVDEYGIQFCDGVAYFSDTYGKDYTIPITDIREIISN